MVGVREGKQRRKVSLAHALASGEAGAEYIFPVIYGLGSLRSCPDMQARRNCLACRNIRLSSVVCFRRRS